MRWFPFGLALSSYSVRRRVLAFLGSVGVSALALSFPVEADASVSTFIGNLVFDTGVAETAAAAGPDEVTAGLAALAAAAVGVGAAVLGYKLGQSFFSSAAPSDVWSWAQDNASNASSWLGSNWSASAGGTVTVSSGMMSSLDSWWSGSSGVGTQLGYGLVGPAVYTDIQWPSYWGGGDGQAAFNIASGKQLGYWVSTHNIWGNNDQVMYAANVPLTWVSNSSGLFLQSTQTPSTLCHYSSYAGGGGCSVPTAPLDIHVWNSTGAPADTLWNSGASVAPSLPWQSGTTVYLPPDAQTSGGDVGVATPTVLPSGDVGLTADGTTAIDTATGAAVQTATDQTAANTGSILNVLSNWFDLSQPIDWSPLENLPWTKTFPFSLPWDLSNAITALVQPPVAPSFDVALPTLGGSLDEYSVTMPSFVSDLIPYVRGAEMVLLNIGLIYGIRSLLGGDV